MNDEIIALVSAVILAVIGLFRDVEFMGVVRSILVKPRHPEDVSKIETLESENRELIKERDIARAVEAALHEIDEDLDDATRIRKAKAMKRLMKSHGKLKDPE